LQLTIDKHILVCKIGNSGDTPDNTTSISSDNDLFISGTVEIDEQLDVDGTGLNDFEGYMSEYVAATPNPTEQMKTYCAAVTGMDKAIGYFLDQLHAMGLDENTIIVFSSDNGPHAEGGADPEFFDSNGPLTGIKRDLYDGGIRVPFIARWPGKIDSGRVTGHISAFWDILPTCADLLGAKLPYRTDGISLLPTLTGKGEQEEHNHLYWEFHEQGGKQALRMGKWKAVRLGVSKDAHAPVMLFDITKDIAEQNDVAEKFPRIAARAARIMAEQHEKSDVYRLLPAEKAE